MRAAVLLVLFSFSGCVFAEQGGEGARAAAPVKKWYAGAALGLGAASGPDWDVVDNYYGSQGYLATGGSGLGIMTGFRIYGGYRLRDYLALEMGFSGMSWDHSTTYTTFFGSSTIWSRRSIYTSALTAAAVLRPPSGDWHPWYVKLGVHDSEYGDTKSVTGTVPNVSAIAAGDRLPLDAIYRGWGPLLGFGVDLETGGSGAVRLEYEYYKRVGGSPYNAGMASMGYHHNF